jgi:phytoene synthase
VYLPKRDLDLFDVSLATLPNGTLDPQDGRLAELIRFEAARAWGWYDRGLGLLPTLDRRSAACCAAMAGIYHELLARIAADPAIVMAGRASLPARDKLRVAVVSLVRGRA